MNVNGKKPAPCLPENAGWITRVAEKSAHNMKHYESCSQSVLAAFMEELHINDPFLLRAAGTLHGGLLTSLTCGVHIAGMMVLGLFLGREDLSTGLDGLMPAVIPAQKLMKRLNSRLGSSSCLELTGFDFTDINQAIAYYSSPEREKCVTRVKEGTEEIANLLVRLEEKGELFRFD